MKKNAATNVSCFLMSLKSNRITRAQLTTADVCERIVSGLNNVIMEIGFGLFSTTAATRE